ncbi:MAG: SRPBCC domain-containing protein [Gammaproteobacteria bacterium]|nr:SRPBCC domain-containing protein [Gammaproteobacteria bacterium]
MAEIRHRVGIRGRAHDIYRLLTTDAGLSQWWTSDTCGAGDVGSIIAFRFSGGGPDFEVIELVVDRKVVWRHSGEMPLGCIGSEISFALEETEIQTLVNGHYNWKQSEGFLAHCSTKWGVFMMSMKSCIETGKGQAYPNDVQTNFNE